MNTPFVTNERPRRARRWRTACLAALALVLAVVLAGCGSSGGASAPTAAGASSDTSAAGSTGALEGTLRLGYFANVTHAPALIGEQEGIFARDLGDGVTIRYSYFNAGTEAVEALFSGAIDAAFVGPNPAINAYAQSHGEALRIVAGTTSGGAALVVRDGIDSTEQLAGTTLATPSLGNTQDVALRAWLRSQGYTTDLSGGGDVSIVPQSNADTLTAFQAGDIDGAWVPEPWASRLILEGGGHVLVNEADLWPGGRFVTTHLVVATNYLREHADIVEGLINGLLDSIDEANSHPEAAQQAANAGIDRITTKALPVETVAAAWKNLTFTADPIASSLQKSKDDAVAAGLLDEVDLHGIYDLSILNRVLAERGLPQVEGL
jgi:NitT/TauT family transport system substrate-binding protein